jgi:hypothetical protein
MRSGKRNLGLRRDCALGGAKTLEKLPPHGIGKQVS